jgi:predicted alpha/beta-fold hydrolase
MTTQQAYSALYTGDYNTVVHHTSVSFPSSPLIGLGFSLGAGVLARYMGEQKERCLLRAGVSLGCPWDVPAMSTV